jgi:GTP-binding protein EngB required for normal cell division
MPTLLDHNLAAHPGGGLPPPPGGNDEGAGHGLRDYHAAKLALAAQLRLLREMLHKRGDERSQRQCEDLLRKLAEDRFTLAVLGQFKRGKSSLLNALVGRELLPVGVLPLTSAITILRFGARERLLIERWSGSEGRTFTTEEPLDRLTDYVAERGNPGNRQRVKAAFLESPTPFLRRGVEFVDTPGVGSAIAANTATTCDFLPSCDAALFVTSADAPLTATEVKFLAEIRQHVRKIFFVLNKTDLLEPAEQAEVVEYSARILREQSGAEEVRVFPISSRRGLQASLRGDPALLQQSGLPALQMALAGFLAGERTQTLLTAVIDKALRLLASASQDEAFAAYARTLSESVRREKIAALAARWREHADTRNEIMGRLRGRLLQAVRDQIRSQFDTDRSGDEAVLVHQFDRLLAHCGWRPCWVAARRIGEGLSRLRACSERQWRKETTWGAMAERMLGELPARTQLRENLATIPTLATALCGLTGQRSRDDDDLLPHWRVRVDVTPFPNASVLLLVPPRATGWLPARWLRRRLRAEFQCRLPAVLAARHRDLADWAVAGTEAELNQWADAVNASAEKCAAHVVALLKGESPADSDFADIGSVRRNLLGMQKRLGERNGGVDASAPPPWNESSEPPPTAGPQRESVGPETASITGSLRTRGCSVCDHMEVVAARFFSQWQYELYAREEVQRDYAARGNLCALHLWQLEAMSSPVGVSVGHARRVERVARALENAASRPAAAGDLAALVPRSDNCRICEQSRAAEARRLDQLAALVLTTEGRTTYARSHGPCLRHLLRLVSLCADKSVQAFLFAEGARHFAEIAEDMQSYGLKTEALRRELRNADEEDAWWRALTHLAGNRRVCSALSCDGEI